jgi:hypothetical protein
MFYTCCVISGTRSSTRTTPVKSMVGVFRMMFSFLSVMAGQIVLSIASAMTSETHLVMLGRNGTTLTLFG